MILVKQKARQMLLNGKATTRVFIYLTIVVSIGSCNYSKNLKKDCLDEWNRVVKNAIEECKSIKAKAHAIKKLKLIERYNLRERVMDKLISSNLINSTTHKIFLIEEFDGDPSGYVAIIRLDEQDTLYSLSHDEYDDTLEFYYNSAEFKMRQAGFENWDNWEDWVPDHRKVFLCEEYPGRQSTRFRFNYTFIKGILDT